MSEATNSILAALPFSVQDYVQTLALVVRGWVKTVTVGVEDKAHEGQDGVVARIVVGTNCGDIPLAFSARKFDYLIAHSSLRREGVRGLKLNWETVSSRGVYDHRSAQYPPEDPVWTIYAGPETFEPINSEVLHPHRCPRSGDSFYYTITRVSTGEIVAAGSGLDRDVEEAAGFALWDLARRACFTGELDGSQHWNLGVTTLP